jgi:hypothetical protein
MNDGKLFEPLRAVVPAENLAPHLVQYAKWLLANPRTLEVWCLAEARLARVECTVEGTQTLELDSGDWFLVRVGGLPAALPTMPTLTGIIRCRRLTVVGKPEDEDSGQIPRSEPGAD